MMLRDDDRTQNASASGPGSISEDTLLADGEPGPVSTVHDRVPGRIRLHVAGLRQSPELQRVLAACRSEVASYFAWLG